MAKNRQNLRSGYTTGACAAAAARAALLALIEQRDRIETVIRLPAGQEVVFALHTCSHADAEGKASVIKDAGDDPDVTDKAEICARATWSDAPGVTIRRGVGVGLVTKNGLPVPPGEPAINPAPRKLIVETLNAVLAENSLAGRGVEVEIAVPNGEALARKTFNPRLGIVGGISILGTTGIVVPYSTAAWLASVVQGIDVAVANGHRHVVLTVGERGERLARKLFPLPEEAFVQIGPFFGDALRHCARAHVEKVTVAAMIGKLAKFAAGHESVHSGAGSQDFLFLAEIAKSVGAGPDVVKNIQGANTAQEVSGLISAAGHQAFFEILCEKAGRFAESLIGTSCDLAVYLTGQDGEALGRYPAYSRV